MVPDLQILCPVDDRHRMILNLTPSGSIGKLDCHHVQPRLPSAHPLHLMPVTVVARTAVEPTFRNLRFIDIGGKLFILDSFSSRGNDAQ